jgi:hypothetical protein
MLALYAAYSFDAIPGSVEHLSLQQYEHAVGYETFKLETDPGYSLN